MKPVHQLTPDEAAAIWERRAPVEQVLMTEQLALELAGAYGLPRDQAVDRVRDAVDDGQIGEPAVDALIAAGWTELDD